MEKMSAIICGAGKMYKDYSEWIMKHYSIVGYADKKRDDLLPSYSYEQLGNVDSDVFLVTSVDYGREIIDVLLNNGVEQKNIRFLQDEVNRSRINKQNYFVQYSQFGEDYVIIDLLKKRGIDIQRAKYIEVGVDYPIACSNTYLLDLLGAEGLLVEANPEMIPIIKVCRKNCGIINRVVVENNDNRPVTTSFNIADIPALSSVFTEEIKKHDGNIKKKVEVKTIVLEECFKELKNVNVLSLDIEGLDNRVLMTTKWDKYHPDIICAETRNPTDTLIRYMKEWDYALYYYNGVNSIWVAAD